MSDFVVAVDGPAGSGKSSVSRAAALRLGFGYLETGAVYRALAWRCLEEGIDTLGGGDVVESLDDFEFGVGTDPNEFFVKVSGEDVTGDIREPRVTAAVSAVARIPEVRVFVNERFRELIAADPRPGIVVEGRDITTVVAPDAAVRVLLTASAEIRSARRAAELADPDDQDGIAQAGSDLHSRDAKDARVVDFMNAAPGVTTLDSTGLTFDETVDALVGMVVPWPAHLQQAAPAASADAQAGPSSQVPEGDQVSSAQESST